MEEDRVDSEEEDDYLSTSPTNLQLLDFLGGHPWLCWIRRTP